MGNILKINVSTLENYQNDFNNEFNYFKSNANNTFDSSYLNRCSDSVVKSMYNNLNTIYDVIEKGYTNINNWWTSYLSNVTTLENFLAGNCNSSGIDDPAVLSAIGYLFDLEGYENNIDGTFSIVEDKYSDMFSFDSPIVAEEENKNLLATGAVFGTSVIEGAGKVGEALLDAAWLGLCIASTPVTGLIDAGNAIYGKITGKDWSSMTKEMWNDTKAMVAEEHVKDWFDDFYENKPIGQILKRNSYNFETVRNIGSGIGYAAGVVAITIATAGVGGVVTGATSAISAASLAGVAGTAAFGRETQNAWADGDDVIKGLEKGVVGGLWEAAQYYVGGKINQLNLFGAGNKFAGSSSKALNNFLNMSTRAGLDGVDSGLDSLFEPLKKAIFNDGYRDSEGKLVNFSENTTFSERFAKYFEDSGGFKGLLENMAIGAGTSFISEIFGSVKDKNKAVEGEIVEDYNIDNPKTKLPPNQTIIDVEGERIGVDYETLDGDVIKDLPTGSKDLIEEFDAKGIGEGSIKGLPPGADDIDVTTNSKNLTGDVSTEKLDIFEEPEMPKTKGPIGEIDLDDTIPDLKPITDANTGKPSVKTNDNGLKTGQKNIVDGVSTEKLDVLDEEKIPKAKGTTRVIDLDDTLPDSKSLTNVDSGKSNINQNDIRLTTNSKKITGDISTEKLEVFEEPKISKTEVKTDAIDTAKIPNIPKKLTEMDAKGNLYTITTSRELTSKEIEALKKFELYMGDGKSSATVVENVSDALIESMKSGNDDAYYYLNAINKLKILNPDLTFSSCGDATPHWSRSNLSLRLDDESILGNHFSTTYHESGHMLWHLINEETLPNNWDDIVRRAQTHASEDGKFRRTIFDLDMQYNNLEDTARRRFSDMIFQTKNMSLSEYYSGLKNKYVGELSQSGNITGVLRKAGLDDNSINSFISTNAKISLDDLATYAANTEYNNVLYKFQNNLAYTEFPSLVAESDMINAVYKTMRYQNGKSFLHFGHPEGYYYRNSISSLHELIANFTELKLINDIPSQRAIYEFKELFGDELYSVLDDLYKGFLEFGK